MLYFAFVQPHIDFGLLLWGNANKSITKVVNNNVKKAVRKILHKKYNHPTKPLFEELKILPFEKQIEFAIPQFMWKVTFDELTENITSLFYRRERTFGDNDIKYHIPNVKLDRTKNSIIFQGPKLWNSINTNLKNKKSFVSFKKATKNFLFNIHENAYDRPILRRAVPERRIHHRSRGNLLVYVDWWA